MRAKTRYLTNALLWLNPQNPHPLVLQLLLESIENILHDTPKSWRIVLQPSLRLICVINRIKFRKLRL